MLHSVNWLDIVGDKELCLLKRGAGERTRVLTRHNLENLAAQRSAEAKSQQLWDQSGKAPQAQLREMGGTQRRQRRTGVRGGEKRGSLVKGFLRPESPRMQGKQEVGLVMCVISTL